MKYRTIKYGSWLMLAIIMLGFNSCEKYFEQTPVSLFSNENVFNNVDYTRQAILGIYQLMTKDEGYSKRVSMYYSVDTDVAMCSGSLDNGRRGIARYAANSGNTEIEKPWRNFYMGIERANICIKQIPISDIYTNGTPDQMKEMKRMYAEALTLRALFYFELVRNWGDVPFKTNPSKAGDNFNLPKTNRDTIYKQIIGDLLEAKDMIGWKSEIDGYPERISKGAVLGLLARISLARGGYSLRKDGKMERDPDYMDYYKIARDYCDTIINSGQHGLHPDFEELFHNIMCAYKLDNEVGESMWEVALGKYDSGEVGYYLSNQESASSRYGRADGGMLILPSFYLSYDSLDTRRDVTVSIYEIDMDNNHALHNFSDIRLAKWRREWIKPLMPGTDKYTGVNWEILRYSDVLLMFAEADNEVNHGPTAAAIDALKQVRDRAYGSNADKAPAIPTDYDGFFNAVVQERAWELAGEAVRKYDLIRWNLLADKLAETKVEMTKIYDQEPEYAGIPWKIAWRNEGEKLQFLNWNTPLDSAALAQRDTIMWPNVANWASSLTPEYVESIAQYFESNRKELLPIHQSIIDANPNLSNDYGY